MTLVNIDPYVILHQKTHVPWALNFVGESNTLPAPCGLCLHKVKDNVKGKMADIDETLVV